MKRNLLYFEACSFSGKARLLIWLRRHLFCLACAFFLVTSPAQANETIEISLIGQAEGTSNYYHDLIRQSLTEAGYSVELDILYDIPQKRYVAMFRHGVIDVVWLIKSAERNQKYVHVDIELTNGFLGQRVLLLPPGESENYADITSLEDFRQSGKVGVFGSNWFDIDVWEANNLPYVVADGDWRRVYDQLLRPREKRGNPPFDYFSRGVSEILYEKSVHPDLEIEPNLLFIYNRDFIFYISDKSKHLKPILEKSLRHAQKSGLMRRLIDHYFSDQLEELNLDQRRKITLKTPE